MKYSQWIGVVAYFLLIGSCFLPWAWYPGIDREFTGFFSESGVYGHPGKLFVGLAVIGVLFFLIPKIWAKRANMLVGALTLAFAIRCYIVFTQCYRGICPQTRIGIYLLLGAALIVLLATLTPDLTIKENKD